MDELCECTGSIFLKKKERKQTIGYLFAFYYRSETSEYINIISLILIYQNEITTRSMTFFLSIDIEVDFFHHYSVEIKAKNSFIFAHHSRN